MRCINLVLVIYYHSTTLATAGTVTLQQLVPGAIMSGQSPNLSISILCMQYLSHLLSTIWLCYNFELK